MSSPLTLALVAASCFTAGQIVIEVDPTGPATQTQTPYSTRKDLHGDPLPRYACARLGSLRFHSLEGITAMAFSADAREIMIYSMPSQALLFQFWETTTGKEVFRFQCEDKGQVRYVRQAALSADGRTVGICRENAIELFDRRTGKRRRTMTLDHDVIALAFSPDGKLLAGGSMEWKEDNPIRVWEVTTGKEQEPFKGRGVSLQSLAFSGDGKKLFSGPTGGSFTQANKSQPIPGFVCVWDVRTRQLFREIAHSNSNVAFARSGTRMALEGGHRQPHMFQAQLGGKFAEGDRTPKKTERRPLDEPGIHVVDAFTGKSLCLLPVRDASFAFTPDGNALVTLDEKEGLRLWDAASGKELLHFSAPLPRESQLGGISPDGKRVAVVAGAWSGERCVRLWNMATGEEIRPFAGHHDEVLHLAFSRDGRLLASASRDQTVRLWDPVSGKELRRLVGHKAAVLAVAFHPDGKMLASSSADGVTRLWKVDSGESLSEFQNPPGQATHHRWRLRTSADGIAFSFSRDGKTLHAIGTNGMVAVWDVVARKEVRRTVLQEEKTLISTAPAFLPGLGAALTANASEFGLESPESLNVWNVVTGRSTQVVPLRDKLKEFVHLECSAVACSPDGRLLASSEKLVTHSLRTQYMNPSLRLFERLTGKQVVQIKEILSQALAFSPDGKILAGDTGSASTWGEIGMYGFGSAIGLWDVSTGKRYATLSGHWARVNCLAFAADGKRLASGGADHSILIWEVPDRKQAPAQGAADALQMQKWWEELGVSDARRAHRAAADLVSHPAETLKLFREKLSPAVPPLREEVATLLKELDSPSFAARDAAQKKLAEFDDRVEPMLREALARNPSSEKQARLKQLTEQLARSPRLFRTARAVAVLEGIGTPDALQFLQTLAHGMPQAHLTRDAREVLERLTHR